MNRSDIDEILNKVQALTTDGQSITPDTMKELKAMMDPTTTRMIQEDTLEFIKTNMNHLPMYYIPQKEFS